MVVENIPLAERMRPHSINTFIGQQHLIGSGKVLHNLLQRQTLHSMILWGPPGVGKTTLAHIFANTLQRPFYSLSAIESGVKDIREVISKAKLSNNTILFIDEIHRFNKSQQDALLGVVETGLITLIGATTENPSFEVINPLLSRCQVYVLKALEPADLLSLLEYAIKNDVILNKKNIVLQESYLLIKHSDGDARKLLNLLEIVVNNCSESEIKITDELVKNTLQRKMANYDKDGEMHYDIISAFIKSMRGSDPNAAVYYLARMIEGGEDPKFIARRMLIFASEDIGNANPTAMIMANNCMQAVQAIGYPECRIILSQVAIYLATSIKSNASYMAIEAALETVKKTGDLSVPLDLRNAPTKLMKNLDYGKEYKYAHHYENNFIDFEFLPKNIENTKFYEPGQNSREEEIRNFLRKRWKQKYNY